VILGKKASLSNSARCVGLGCGMSNSWEGSRRDKGKREGLGREVGLIR